MASLAAVRRHVPCVHDNVSHIGRKIAQRLDEREKTTEEKFREVKLELRAIRAVNRKLLEALRTMQSEVEVLRDDMSRTAENG